MTDEIIFRRDMEIGNLSAEADQDFLDSCFIETAEYNEIKNYENRKMIILGRTGAGKTALLNKAKEEADVVVDIKPNVFVLQYIDNVPFIRQLKEEKINLEVFYKFLWLHEILSSIVKNYFKYYNKNYLMELCKFGSDSERIKQLKNYVKQYDDVFFAEGTKEKITDQLESKLEAEMGFKNFAKIASTLSESQKKEIQSKTSQYVSKTQINQLKNLISILKDYFENNKQKKILVTIDNLDENWTDEESKYKLINSLLDTIRFFIGIPSLKILIAMRNDLLSKTVEVSNRQNEKDESYTIKLNWSPTTLTNLIDKRLQYMFEFKYKKNSKISFKHIFDCFISETEGYNYILERTMMRPRDVISFVNQCIKQADGRTSITPLDIINAEKLYCDERLTALKHEWHTLYPNVECYIKAIRSLGNRFNYFNIKDNYQTVLDSLLNSAIENQDDPIVVSFLECNIDNDNCVNVNIKTLVNTLFTIGVVGIEFPDGTTLYSNADKPKLSQLDFDDDIYFVIHPLFAKRKRSIAI